MEHLKRLCFLLLLISSFTIAVCDFKPSLSPDAGTSIKTGFDTDIIVQVNKQSVSKSLVTTDYACYKDYIKYGFNITSPFPAGQVSKIKNLTLEWRFGDSFEQVGTGLLWFPDSRELWEFADLFEALKTYQLIVTEKTTPAGYQLTITNFSSATKLSAGAYLYLDPSVQFYNRTNFTNGAFWNTEIYPYWSMSVGPKASGGWLLNDTAYFSNPLEFGNLTNVQGVNCSWFEAYNFNTTDGALLSMHLENDTLDTSYKKWAMFPFGSGNNQGWTVGAIGYGYNFSRVPAAYFQSSASGPISSVAKNFTVSAWIKVNQSAPLNNQYRGIVSESLDPSPMGINFILDWYGASTSSVLRFGVSNGTFLSNASYAMNLTPEVWYHVVGRANLSQRDLFLNGSRLASSPVLDVRMQNFGGPLEIGREFFGSTYTFRSGVIDEVHIFPRWLNDSEINSIYNDEYSRLGTDNFAPKQSNISTALRGKNYTFNDTGLLGWWDLGDSTDNEAATNGSMSLVNNGSTAFMFNATAVINTSCVIGKCLYFNGTNYMIAKPNYYDGRWLNQSGISYAGWFNIPARSFSVLTKNGIGIPSTSSNTDNWFGGIAFLPVRGILSARFTIRNLTGTAFLNITATMPLNDSNWHHVATTFNVTDQTMNIYIDGVLNASDTVSNLLMGGAPTNTGNNLGVFIGAAGTSGDQAKFLGSIDDVKFWNRTLSPDEIYNLANPANEYNWSQWTPPVQGCGISTNLTAQIAQFRANFTSTTNLTMPYLFRVWLDYGGAFNVTIGERYINYTTYSVNVTESGKTALFTANWQSNNLTYYIFEFDNGNGTLYNTSANFTGMENTSWAVVHLNDTNQSLIRWRFYAVNNFSDMNSTPNQSFYTMQYPIDWGQNTCPSGAYLANRNVTIAFWDSTLNHTCFITIFDENLTSVYTNTSYQSAYFHYVWAALPAGNYYAAQNCTDGKSWSERITFVDNCIGGFLKLGDEFNMGLEFNLLWLFWLAAIVFVVAGFWSRQYLLLLIGGVLTLVSGVLLIIPDANIGLSNVNAINTTITSSLSGYEIVTTPNKVYETNYLVYAMGGLLIIAGVGLSFAAISYLFLPDEKRKVGDE